MRRPWGWSPRSSDRSSNQRSRANRRDSSRYYRLGVERLEDRHLLNGGPLSLAGDAAMALLPTATTTTVADLRRIAGPVQNQTNQMAFDADDLPAGAFHVDGPQSYRPEQPAPEMHIDVSATQTIAAGGIISTSSISIVEITQPVSPLNSGSVVILFSIDNYTNYQMRGANGQPLLDYDAAPTQRGAPPMDPRTAGMSSDAAKARADRGTDYPDLSSLAAFAAARVEVRETAHTVGDDARPAMATTAAVASSSASPVAAHAAQHEIELVSALANDANALRFVWPVAAGVELDPGIPLVGDAVRVDAVLADVGDALPNEGEITRADQVTEPEIAGAEVTATRASLLDSLPVDFRAVDQALNELLSEIEALGGDLSGWLDITKMPPWAVAAGVVAASGVGGWCIRRTRLRRAHQQQLEEESSSWMFTQSHGFATGSTL
jgi:hypothetical protein